MPNKIILTGSSGIIGKILKERLKEKYKLFLLDKRGQKEPNFFNVNISNFKETKKVFLRIKADTGIQLAGDSNINASWDSVLKNNIIGIQNIFEASCLSKVKKIIYASTGHITGIKKKGNVKTKTSSNPKPSSPYALSKYLGEVLGKYYSEKYNISVICLRIGAVLADNDPSKDKIHRSIWLSHNDLESLVIKSMKSNVKYGIFYGISKNTMSFWDISDAKKKIEYSPRDNAERFF